LLPHNFRGGVGQCSAKAVQLLFAGQCNVAVFSLDFGKTRPIISLDFGNFPGIISLDFGNFRRFICLDFRKIISL
jgi:hypothetical protein